jgi:serine/threonine-protein kinase
MSEVDPDETAVFEGSGAAPASASATASAPRPPRALVAAAEAPGADEAFRALRQGRLRAAAVFLAALSSLFAAIFLAGGGVIGLFHLAAAACLWTAVVRLSRRPMSPMALRLVEDVVFGVMTANLVAGQYVAMRGAPAAPSPLMLQLVIDTTLVGSILLMFAYAVLIPNSGRGAAALVLLFLLAPLAVTVLVFRLHPGVLAFARAHGVSRFGNPVLGAAAAGLAVYGAHVLHTMRQEVFEARRLNQYTLRGRIGAGGMGEVHRAEHRLLSRPCAVKLIRPEAAGDPRALDRFAREVRAAARLSHPNIVEVYDYGRTDDGTFYHVMELLDGLDLGALVAAHGPLPPGRVVYLLRQACDGLAEAHAAGLVHRDIKPGNVFAACIGTRADVVKLLDFGLVADARAGSALADAGGAISGTPQYMAPEQAAGAPGLDGRADLYALGAVAYALLTGRPPFGGRTPLEAIAAHAREAVAPPSRHVPTIPADLEAVVLRCLAKDPAARFPDARALGAALAACRCAGDWDADRAAAWWRERHAGGALPHPAEAAGPTAPG